MTRSGLTWQNIFSFGILALVILALFARCKPAYVPLDDPPITIVDADAAGLADAGPDAGLCALACAALASQVPPCQEANGACLVACERAREVRNGGQLIGDTTFNCLTQAKDRDAIHKCGVACP